MIKNIFFLFFIIFQWSLLKQVSAQTISPGARKLVFDATLKNGRSKILRVSVPNSTKSVTIVVQGKERSLYALGSFKTANGREKIGLLNHRNFKKLMKFRYFEEEDSDLPGDFRQNMKLGTFTNTYPNKPGQRVESGVIKFALISSLSQKHSVKVSVFMPPNDQANILHLNIINVSNRYKLKGKLGFIQYAQKILDQARIQLNIDQIYFYPSNTLNRLTDFYEPQEPPYSQASKLAKIGVGIVETDALNVFVVDQLPGHILGLSLGLPGPPIPSSYFNGVIIRLGNTGRSLGKTLAHEISHYLGIPHIRSKTRTGRINLDQFEDTYVHTGNLMENGEYLSPEQASIMRKSPWLKTR